MALKHLNLILYFIVATVHAFIVRLRKSNIHLLLYETSSNHIASRI